MGPPTISADQLVPPDGVEMHKLLQWGRRRSRRINVDECNSFVDVYELQWGRRRSRRINPRNCIASRSPQTDASMGPPTISADQHEHATCCIGPAALASMGPPTISADQRFEPCLWCNCRHCFNGAADDLGGSTREVDYSISLIIGFNGAADDLGGSTCRSSQFRGRQPNRFNGAADDLGGSTSTKQHLPRDDASLQWGRRRSRRINPGACHMEGRWKKASMGPPTISADQQHAKTPNRGSQTSFNGAADDLGGSTCWRRCPWTNGNRASMGPPTISADQRHPIRCQNITPVASMGPPTISADQH